MMPKIVIALPKANRKVWLEYEDGAAGEVDFSELIDRGGVFEKLRDPAVFEQVQIGEHGRYIEFPGDVDFCADALREKLVPINRDAAKPK